MVDLTVSWRILGLRVAPNWFLCTDAENNDTVVVFSPCVIPSRNLFVTLVCVINMHHLSQLPDFLVAVGLAIT